MVRVAHGGPVFLVLNRSSYSYRVVPGQKSMPIGQKALGFAFFVAFLMTVIFIVVSSGCADRLMRQRNERRIEACLATCRRVHVAKLRV